ncbi:MAG: bifunctional (p)ppGpp synthetase/guanosine-3',5'-bis(diphosphate) 3'-pyrophosphohydrolase [Clostridiales bacterium]|jgi:GTP pyrophosphokinase|nr:bifunctional (p)ppGpp synthetase/guanosine-3',5'-bis(diphosphate) 3'-pyrophosphohydrolase [Clostridiales bacterium]
MKDYQITYEELLDKVKKYLPNSDLSPIQKAYEFAKQAHSDQKRVSGEDYINHPLAVANMLADMELDIPSIIAAILHDVVEDTIASYADIEEQFGSEVAHLVEGVTKLGKIPYSTKEEQQAENLRKMFLAMAKDIRVILIKLADRTHNMRTLKAMPEDKQREKACETMEVYAPIAHRLGMSKIKWELEDLSLRYLDPIAYAEISDNISQKRDEREEYLDNIKKILADKLKKLRIEATIESRAKHFFSIYRKMYSQNIAVDQIYDLLAVRIIVTNITECYTALGMVHETFKPVPGRIKDYIAMPKSNMYQSLHTTVMGPNGQPFEVQIRTKEMHHIAEVGIAAHWKYKEGVSGKSDMDGKLEWIRQLLDIHKDANDAEEIVSSLKIDLFEDEVFVFSPKGDVIDLPIGSTPIDFAYSIHSAIGNKTVGAKINGKMRPLDVKLKNGDIVEVITSKTANGPSRDWLKVVKTSQAKKKINDWFRKENKEENVTNGRAILERELQKIGLLELSRTHATEWQPIVLRKYTAQTIDDLYAMIGYGGLSVLKVLNRIKDCLSAFVHQNTEQTIEDLATPIDADSAQKSQPKASNGVIVKGLNNCLVRFSRCCNPVFGDDIIGYITRGRGVSVHRTDCINIADSIKTNDERLIEVRWGNEHSRHYLADIQIVAQNYPMLIANIASKMAEIKVPMRSSKSVLTKDGLLIINMLVEIANKSFLDRVIKKLQAVEGIITAKRKTK